jgi:uncharacterized protein (DUF1778 family)
MSVKNTDYAVYLPVNKQEKALIEQGAKLSGRSMRQYIKSASIKQAIHIIEKHKRGIDAIK